MRPSSNTTRLAKAAVPKPKKSDDTAADWKATQSMWNFLRQCLAGTALYSLESLYVSSCNLISAISVGTIGAAKRDRVLGQHRPFPAAFRDRKSTRLNST